MTLAGDMSLVGTHPPTVDEWDKYELHHRARLATKPGLTGMWQVSGRSNITDFPGFTEHGMQHSLRIIEYIYGIMSEELKQNISDVEIFCFIMS